MTQSELNEMITRGNDKAAKMIGLIIRCRCSAICTWTFLHNVVDFCRAVFRRALRKMIERAEKIFARNGAIA